MHVLGTRPEAIKLAPVVQAMAADARVRQLVVVTAQHRELLDQALGLFGITPDHDLNAMQPATTPDLPFLLGSALGPVMSDLSPDLVVVQGDTATALAGAMVAGLRRIPVVHVEAGLRTHDRNAPFPEEINRQLITRLASFHFAPTKAAKTNLLEEGVPEAIVEVTGNTIVDAFLAIDCILSGPAGRSSLASVVAGSPPEQRERLHRALEIGSGPGPFVLVTVHRRESVGKPLERICAGLKAFAEANPGVPLLLPVHPNPSIGETVTRILSAVPNVLLLPPLDYLMFLFLLKACRFVVTDSGGVQEEAAVLRKALVVTRDVTERPEALDRSSAYLVGSCPTRLADAATEILRQSPDRAWGPTRYWRGLGDGQASARIAARIVELVGIDRASVQMNQVVPGRPLAGAATLLGARTLRA